jgi:class 3 adenylate cyclase/transcriptional regulator with XRE-family HTH domain
MSEAFPAVHRSIICVDVEKFASHQRTNSHQIEIRKGLHHALGLAFSRSRVPEDTYEINDRGDGALVLISPEVPKGLLATNVITELAAALDGHNDGRDPRAQIRLRAAIHAGEVIFDDYGVAGAAVNLTFRLLDASPLRQALAASPSVLALIASPWFFQEVIYHTPAGAPEDYARVRVSVKETKTHGWVRLLGQDSELVEVSRSAASTGIHEATIQRAAGTSLETPRAVTRQDGWPGPLLARMRLAIWLRQLRTSAHSTRERAATEIGRSAATLGRWERAESGADPTAVEALLAFYGMHATPERNQLLSLAQEANTPGWIQSFRDVLPAPEALRIEMEQIAPRIRSYHDQLIPPLLQTPEYARAVGWPAHAAAPATRLDRRIELLLRCQQILHQPDPPHVWGILDMAALRNRAVPAQVMRRQLEHLAHLTELPHLALQLVPQTSTVATHDPFTIFRFSVSQIPDVVCLEHPTSRAYLYHRDGRYPYQHVMDRLSVLARQPNETIKTLHELLKEM